MQLFMSCLIGVFFISLIPSLSEVTNEFYIIIFATNVVEHDNETGEVHENVRQNSIIQIVLTTMVVLYELLIWVCVLMVGIVYILTTEGIGNIIQAAVAISFINEIDNMAVMLFADGGKRSGLTKFECKRILKHRDVKDFFTYFALPSLVCVSVALVFGLHRFCC